MVLKKDKNKHKGRVWLIFAEKNIDVIKMIFITW